ncbi:MAG: hypothetical protein ACT4NL_07940, partial [Pseudomarimonas sp.]
MTLFEIPASRSVGRRGLRTPRNRCLARIFHEGAWMIAQGFAASARRDEPEWWAHCGEKQRSDCRKEQARAAPAG